MKVSPVLLAASALACLVAADESPVIAPSAAPSSARNGTKIGIQELVCDSPSQTAWYYNSKNNGPHSCIDTGENRPWGMLNSYREGGTEGVHWKYSNNREDPECLMNWNYYASDGTTLIRYVPGALTMHNSPRYWCALRVYRSGGVQGYQWDYCHCVHYNDPGRPIQ